MSKTWMRAAAICLFGVMAVSADDLNPPTWKGLVCEGWHKPWDQLAADGDTSGDELVVNTPLTQDEKEELRAVREVAEEAYKIESRLTNDIIKNHGYKLGGSTGSMGPCGEFVMIRADEYHITQFVPSNPLYPGDGGGSMFSYNSSKAPSECRAYFAKLREKAVAATYGRREQP